MRYSFLLLFLFFGTALYAQVLEKKLLGKWMMAQVIQDNKDVTTEHNPGSNRFFIFNEDGTFESGGDPYGPNTGRYFVNNLNSTWYLDSSQGPDDDSLWKITFEKERMIWTGLGTEWAESFKLIHVRAKE